MHTKSETVAVGEASTGVAEHTRAVYLIQEVLGGFVWNCWN
jgi:hypothetical protein